MSSSNMTSTSPAKAAANAAYADRMYRAMLNYECMKDMWYFAGAFLAVLAAVRVVDVIANQIRKAHIRRNVTGDKQEIEGPSAGTRGGVSLRRLPQALLAQFRIVAFRWTIPYGDRANMLVAEAVVILGYFLGMLVWALTRTHGPQAKYYDDRAGNLASSQIPLVVALAGKNNIVSLLTGISHEKLNIIHRASGRALLVLLWVHGWGRWKQGLATYASIELLYVKMGIVGLCALSLAAVLSLRPIRHRFYEFFLVTHIVLIAVFIAGGWAHMQDTAYYFWPGFLVWGLDRGLRVGRLLFFNCRWWRKEDKLTQGKVELISKNTVRLTLRRPMTWTAGQHAFVILPSVSTLPFEAHPFTIASICGPVDGSAAPAENDLVFVIRGRSGFTRRLREHATDRGTGNVTALIDGPYGLPPDLSTVSVSVLVAGGSGITYTLPLLLQSVRDARRGKSAVRRILFVWAIKDAEDLNAVSSSLLKALAAAPTDLDIDTRIFVTRATSTSGLPALSYSEDDVSQTSSQDEKAKKKSSSDTALSQLKTEIGRPDVRALLKQEIEVASGKVSVDVAGPAELAQEVRSLLRSSVVGPMNVLKGTPTVSLHVETFGLVGA